MTKDEIKAKVISISHRTDMVSKLDSFIADAEALMQTRFSEDIVPLDAGSDENVWSQKHSLLYVYGTLTSMYEYVNEGENAAYYKGRWDEVASLAFTSFVDTLQIRRV